MSVLRCALFFAAVTAALGCDAGVDQIYSPDTACGVNDDGRYYSCRCPWFKCTTTSEEFEEAMQKIARGSRDSFGTCSPTGMTIAFIVVGVLIVLLLICICAWCCCCKGFGCSCTALFAGGCCCDKTERTMYTTVAPAY